ncbi:hypothetical protein Y032_0009g646 [Ancylostoma ceylanicum]|uniref:Uncharacterized protein n=1 Tax=Ancylostoma ceylanicum TaxID=53326 RepID=A0A016VJU5_9BILA|nr:hypothetical protein Y032_0009g646 [Ancylostoma ceylanicum]
MSGKQYRIDEENTAFIDSGILKNHLVTMSGHRRPFSECFPYESIQIGRFYATAPNSEMRSSKRINSIYICRSQACIKYCVGTQQESRRYISTFSVPFDLIDGIYANGRHLFIRDLNNVTTPRNLCCQAKSIVSRNSRVPPKLRSIREPYVKIRRKHADSSEEGNPQSPREPAVLDFQRSLQQTVEPTFVTEALANEETLPSAYSLAEIPGIAADSETPVLKTMSYHSPEDEGFPDVLHGLSGQCDFTSAATTTTSDEISTPEESQPFPNLYDIPLSGEVRNCSSFAMKSPDSNPDGKGVPSLYAQPEYRSNEQELHCSLPVCTDNVDVDRLPSRFPSDDISTYFSSLEDISATSFADLARLDNPYF